MSHRLTRLLTVAVLIGAGIGAASAFDRRIRIKNETGQAIVSLQAVSQESGWSGQVMGGLAPGKAAMATIDDGSGACVYVFTAQLSDGSSRRTPSVNVCDLSVYAIR